MMSNSTRIATQPLPQTNHVRFYFNQLDRLKRCLDNEQMGRLFFAVMDYGQTGERDETVEDDIRWPYEDFCDRIDRAGMPAEGGRM